ncbi:hypothetical protein QJQ45_010997 [Haematococcus lacustris]|nr:hypothetical protein QJQ45_010997 [Haematococcus lacustris]
MEKSSSGDVDTGQQLPGLQGLPAEPLDAILRRLDARSRLPVFRTSKLLATALLRVVPRIQLTYPTPHDIIGQHLRELAPFLTEVLQNRQQPKLHLTLRPAWGFTIAMQQRRKAEPAAAASDRKHLVARMLGAVSLCGAVDSLTIDLRPEIHLPWEDAFSTALASSFPSLTSLTFHGDVSSGSISVGHLATAINHPLLLPRLVHLDLMDARITAHQGELGRSPFIGSRVQTLRLDGWVEVRGGREFLSGLLPLPPTLTQLEMSSWRSHKWDWDKIAAAVSSLTQLQQLRLLGVDRGWYDSGPGPMSLLPALAHLPRLHTLVLDEYVVGQEQLDALLELTQITRLQVPAFSGLTSSRASAACSWRQLEVHTMDWVTAAYLPLHSLTHPLRLYQLLVFRIEDVERGNIEELSMEVLAAAELNLCERNKAGLVLDLELGLTGRLWVRMATVDLLTERYLSHPTVASSSSHSGPSTSLLSSSSLEGHSTPGGAGSSTGQGGQQGSAAGAHLLMQRLGRHVKAVRITEQASGEGLLSSDHQQALAVLFPNANIKFMCAWERSLGLNEFD